MKNTAVPAALGMTPRRKRVVPVLSVLLTLLLGASAGSLAWRLRDTEEQIASQGAAASGCELRTSHSDHCGEEGTWRPAGCNIRNEGTQPCGGPFWGHVFYCMGEHEACNDGYGRFYAEGKPKQKQTLYPDERLDMRSVKPLPICTTMQADVSGGGKSDAKVCATPPESGDWVDCTTCENLAVSWDPDNNQVVMASGSLGNAGGTPGGLDLDGAEVDFIFKLTGGGLDLSAVVSAAEATCVDRRVLDEDGKVLEPRERDPYEDYGMACAAAHTFADITFVDGETYTASVAVRDPQYGEAGWRTAPICSSTYTYTTPQPPVCENLVANPTSLPYTGGTVTLTAAATRGDGGELTYEWGASEGDVFGYDDDTPDIAGWSIAQNSTRQPVSYSAWVTVSNELGSSGGEDSVCSVSVPVAAYPENDLTCDQLTVFPPSPAMGDVLSFTCVGTSQLQDESGSPYPITRIDFRVYLDTNSDGVFQATEIIREGGVVPSGVAASWSATYEPDPPLEVAQAGYYGAASRVCIEYEGSEQCTSYATPGD